MPFPEPDLPASPVTDPTIVDSHAIFGEDEEDTDGDGESDEVQGDHHVRATPISIISPAPISPPVPDPRRLFQRLWTDDDEILILEGFLEFTSQRGTTGHAHQHDTGPFYERIRSQVELDFSKSQLVEKLRRLKKKFRTNMAKMNSDGGTGKEAFFAFKSAHDRKAYEISEKIWGGGLDGRKCDNGIGDGGKIRKRGRKSGEVGLEVKVEETATTSSAVLAVAAAPDILKMDLPMVEDCVRAGLGERWRQQQILELEVYSYAHGFSYLAFSTTAAFMQHLILFFWNRYEVPALQRFMRNRAQLQHQTGVQITSSTILTSTLHIARVNMANSNIMNNNLGTTVPEQRPEPEQIDSVENSRPSSIEEVASQMTEPTNNTQQTETATPGSNSLNPFGSLLLWILGGASTEGIVSFFSLFRDLRDQHHAYVEPSPPNENENEPIT